MASQSQDLFEYDQMMWDDYVSQNPEHMKMLAATDEDTDDDADDVPECVGDYLDWIEGLPDFLQKRVCGEREFYRISMCFESLYAKRAVRFLIHQLKLESWMVWKKYKDYGCSQIVSMTRHALELWGEKEGKQATLIRLLRALRETFPDAYVGQFDWLLAEKAVRRWLFAIYKKSTLKKSRKSEESGCGGEVKGEVKKKKLNKCETPKRPDKQQKKETVTK